MTVSVIQIGLRPDVIDYGSPEFAGFPGLTAEKLQVAHDGNIEQLRQLGYDVDGCQVDLGETAADVVRERISQKEYDAILIGAGVRLVPSNTRLFESLVNLIHTELPSSRFVFNRAPETTPEDIRRYFPDPNA